MNEMDFLMEFAGPAATETSDGIILPGSEFGNAIGFTFDLFRGYMFRDGGRIMVSLLTSLSPGSGNMRLLFANIAAKGYRISVPTPLGRMKHILERHGYTCAIEECEVMGPVEVWTSPVNPIKEMT